MSETDEKQQTALDAHERIRDVRLDRAIAAVVEEEPPPGSERTAGERVSRALGLTPIGNSQLTDYQALIPDYLAGRLTDAQRLLFEDEAATSIPLRRALAAARGGAGGDRVADLAQATAPMPARRPVPAGRRAGRLHRRWIYGVAAAAVVAIAAVLAIPTFDRPDVVRVARVEAVEGILLRQAGARWLPLAEDEWLDDGQRLATKQGGTAVIALQDGSKVEVAPRSQLRLTRARGGNRVRVDQGNVIVQVAPQRDGTFDIATDDLVVAVVGTTLGVGHGTKGSRVAVIEGEVEVRHGGKTTSLKAGDQYGTGKTTAMALEETVAWSRDAERYAELLRAYAEFHRDFGEALTAGNRHSTRLLDLVPARTSIYVAVPNAPATIAEAYEAVVAFHDQLPAGEFPVHATTATVEAVVGWLGEIGEHLGPETVLALHWEEVGSLARSASNRPAKEAASKVDSNDDLARHSEPPVLLVLAEARPSLRQVIEDKLVEAARAVGHPDIGVDLVDEPQQAREGRLGIWLDDGLFAASPTPSALVELQAVLDGGANPFRDGELFARLVEVYDRGAEYVAGADLAKLGLDGFHDPLVDFRGARTAVVEHRLDGERGFAALEVRFDHDDPDRVALLDQPGPMGALRFFSPDATLASAVVLPDSEKLRAVLNAWLRDSPAARGRQSAMPELVESLIGMLGGEIAVALDGPLLPQPSWKAVVEVYDPAGLQQAVDSWLGLIKVVSGDDGLGVRVVEGATPEESVYRLSVGGVNIHYAYIDGYLVVGGNRAVLDRARQIYASGVTLLDAEEFQELLPLDSYLDFSALSYARLDGSLALPLLNLMTLDPDTLRGQVLDELRQILEGAAMFGVYNEPDRIRLVANGSNVAPFYGLPMLPALGAGVFDGSIRVDVHGPEDGT